MLCMLGERSRDQRYAFACGIGSNHQLIVLNAEVFGDHNCTKHEIGAAI